MVRPLEELVKIGLLERKSREIQPGIYTDVYTLTEDGRKVVEKL